MRKVKINGSLAVFLVLFLQTTKVNGVSVEAGDSSENLSQHSTGHYEIEENILKNLTKNTFLTRIRPNGTTFVKVNIYVRDAQMKTGSKISINLYNPWTMDLILRQSWNDPRLVYDIGQNPDYQYISLNNPKFIWKPDIFFPDADKGDFQYITTPNALVRVDPNGNVLYTVRLSLSLPCRQSSVPRRFGHGIGIPVACPLRLSSFGYTSDQLILDWDDKDPLEINENLYTENNSYCLLDKAFTNATSQVHTRTGNYSVISAEFQFLC